MKAEDIEHEHLVRLVKTELAHLAYLFSCNDEILENVYSVADFEKMDDRILKWIILHAQDKNVAVGKLLSLHNREHKACLTCIHILKKLKMFEWFSCDVCKKKYLMDKFKQPCPFCGAKWEKTGVILFPEE